MSAGGFTLAVYESNVGTFHWIKQQPESAIFSIDGSPNTIPAGPVNSPFWAKTSKAAKEYGLRPRKLRFRFNAGTEPDGYEDCGTLDIVVYSKSVFLTAVLNTSASYMGAPGKIVGRVPEQIYPSTIG
jgi:hypothetical protein